MQTGGEAGDDWDKVQGGFRIDSQWSTEDELTVQGDLYHSNINQLSVIPQTSFPFNGIEKTTAPSYGGNLLGRLQHTFSPTSEYSLQFYYDYYNRDDVWGKEGRNTLDLDFQHRFMLLDWHEIVWGFGYRYSHDDFKAGRLMSLTPDSRNDQLYSAFVQDEMTLIDNTLWLTLGSKFEHNDYSGFEAQPSAKIMWAPHLQHRLWAAVSRAVRTPSRAEHDSQLALFFLPPQTIPYFPYQTPPTELVLQGTPSYDSEEVLSYEIGYRTTISQSLSVDITAFYNDYDNLRSHVFGEASFNNGLLIQPILLSNQNSAKTYGFEVATVWQMLDWWRWDANYSLLKADMDADTLSMMGASPQQRVSLRGALSLEHDVDLDLWLRYVDSSISIGDVGTVKDYLTMDIRLAWRPYQGIELSLVGQNLLDQHHFEYQQETLTLPTEIDRGMYGKLLWNF